MRVAYLTNNPNLGSTIRVVTDWLRLGPGRGLWGSVVLPQPGPLADWLAEHQVSHCFNPMPTPSRLWPWPGLRYAWALARWMQRRDIQVIHCQEHNVYPFGLLLRWMTGLPLVCTVQFAICRRFAQWAFAGRRCPDALIWTSQQQKSDCHEAVVGLVPDAVQHVVPLGLDVQTFAQPDEQAQSLRNDWAAQPDTVVIGTASALRPRKRIHEFLEMACAVMREHADVVTVIAGDAMPGDEGYRDQLHAQARESGFSDRIHWPGNLDEVAPFMQAIDLFVSTSDYETFGMSVCEAMACGKPIVGYRGGSVHEVVGGTGCIVETGDLAGLTSAVAGLVGDTATRQAMGAAARQRVINTFDARQSLSRIIDLYTHATRTKEAQPCPTGIANRQAA